ncbi:uncharacterized protein LOC143239889 [Tachypleus tridentatus]|uniref:uncharacterized protein LOC143239889 n=1 Tax=Tachypleus tridentatus TaxID=6853 RepID=UPI003FD6A020
MAHFASDACITCPGDDITDEEGADTKDLCIKLIHAVANALEIISGSQDRDSAMQFPVISRLLKVFAALPVSTTSVEHSFSTLRRLKTYLRNITTEDQLNGLGLITHSLLYQS